MLGSWRFRRVRTPIIAAALIILFLYHFSSLDKHPSAVDKLKEYSPPPKPHSLIPKHHWSVPSHINRTHMHTGMRTLIEQEIIYGGSMSYRHMCRFNSGFFMHHPALASFSWYWRVEPDIDFTCDVQYDPFTFLRTKGKIYGFVISMYEFAPVPREGGALGGA